MVYFITGAVNIGKSSHLLRLYRSLKKGDGFYNRKIYSGNTLAGQEIVHLATDESKPFSYREGFIPENWLEESRYGAFSFSRSGLAFGREIINKALDLQIEPLFIDEIGPLELQGQGFRDVFENLSNTSTEIYAVVRRQSLDDVIREFGIKKFIVIEVTADKCDNPLYGAF